MFKCFRVCAALVVWLGAASAAAQEPAETKPAPAANPQLICGQEVPAPRALPPAGSGPVVYLIAPCFEAQGGTSLIEPQTYLYYIQQKASRPSEGVWVLLGRDEREDDPGGLSPPLEHELPRQSLD